VNLRFIFEKIFSVERGGGYPPHRREAQREVRLQLERVSVLTHRPFAEIIVTLPDAVVRPALEYPGIRELIDVDSIDDPALKATFRKFQ
jgi:hypothetical protein